MARGRLRAALRPRIEVLEPRRPLSGDVRPDDPSFDLQYGLASPVDADIDAPAAWSWTTGRPSTLVAVIDVLGVDTTHPDLYLKMAVNPREIPGGIRPLVTDTNGDGQLDFYDLNSLDTRGQVVRNGSGQPVNAAAVADADGNGRIDAGDLLADRRWADGVDQDTNGRIDDLVGWDFSARRPKVTDPDGHGTHVAGVIAAQTDNAVGIAGIDWQARILPLKFSSLDQAVDAIYYAANRGARVINCSWGYYESQLNVYYKGDIERAINYANYKGAVVVAAAGNTWNGPVNDNDANAFYPSSFNTLPNVMSVAATNRDGDLAYFSNVGKASVTLGAPGQDIYSTS
ncbi:MAG TPA: S8 family serine peptidase, partial [Isosphaeraceae bacterium]